MSRPLVEFDVFRAIADPTRRAVLDLLGDGGERPVGKMSELFPMSLPAFSRHLKVLRDAGLVYERVQGRQRLYRLAPQPLEDVSQWVRRYEHFWKRKLSDLGQHLEENQ